MKRRLYPTWKTEITPEMMVEMNKIVAIMHQLNLKAIKGCK